MTVHTEGFRKAHAELEHETALLRRTAAALPLLDHTAREVALRKVLAFLRETVEPHTRVDERVLYPEVQERLGDPLVTASMNYDHIAIRDFIDQIGAADPRDADRLQELLYGLDALIRVHLWKENELYVAPLESPTWPAGS